MAVSLEPEIQRIGRELADAFPSAARHPVKALDDKAMELASRDAELRAALFRFVDVVPACRSLDDLARHLSAFLDEVDERPPSLDAAMRMADSKAGARALGLAATAGVRHMAHRFIVGETPRDALRLLARPLAARRRGLRGPARRGDDHGGGGRPLRGAVPRRRCGRSHEASARLAAAAGARARFGRARSRART